MMYSRVLWLVAWFSVAAAVTTDSISEALAGSSARLTCDISPDLPGDQVVQVTWYRQDSADDSPIYTYDARGQTGNRWSDHALGERIYMRAVGGEAQLTIDPVDASDEAQYRCSVDFRRGTTRTAFVNLTVVVPPKEIVVTDDSGTPVKNGMTMQYAEGASATLTCVASGGRPLARVSWWRNGLLLDDTDVVSNERRRTRNVLHIERLTRRDLLTVYVCEATNSLLQPPLQVPVTIDMYLRPLDVRLLGQNTPLSAGSVYEMSCQTHGSRPPAHVTWHKDGLPLVDAPTRELVSADGNSTTSILSLLPQVEDSGMTLQCRVSNPRIPNSELRDTWMLHVLYTPRVTLTLGANLNASNIREAADVYFECHITANPWVHRVMWNHDGKRLVNNQTAGIIVSNQTLVLQSVTKSSSGIYKCTATNGEGTSDSNGIHLDVKYDPVCGRNPQRVFGAAKQEQVTVECRVDANPPATMFRWTFNNTASNSVEVSTFSTEGQGKSVLTYTPYADSDYGTLLCWGRNTLGSQAVPCMFHVVPAGRPDPPYNCTASNKTHHSFIVSCSRGFDGGLRQRFSLLVTTIKDGKEQLVLNVTSGALPEFTVTGLESGQEYTLMGFAYNEKGWSRGSQPVIVATLMQPNLHEQRRSTAPTAAVTMSTSTWLYIGLGLVGTLLVAGIGIGAAIRVDRACCTRRDSSETGSELEEQGPKQHGHVNNEGEDMKSFNVVPLEEAADPDLILLTNDPYCHHMYGPTYAPYTISTGTNVTSSTGTSASCSGLQSCLSNPTVPRPLPKRNCATQMPMKPYHVTWGPDTHIHEEVFVTSTPPPPPIEVLESQVVEYATISRRSNAQTQTSHLIPTPPAMQEMVVSSTPPRQSIPSVQQHKESSV